MKARWFAVAGLPLLFCISATVNAHVGLAVGQEIYSDLAPGQKVEFTNFTDWRSFRTGVVLKNHKALGYYEVEDENGNWATAAPYGIRPISGASPQAAPPAAPPTVTSVNSRGAQQEHADLAPGQKVEFTNFTDWRTFRRGVILKNHKALGYYEIEDENGNWATAAPYGIRPISGAPARVASPTAPAHVTPKQPQQPQQPSPPVRAAANAGALPSGVYRCASSTLLGMNMGYLELRGSTYRYGPSDRPSGAFAPFTLQGGAPRFSRGLGAIGSATSPISDTGVELAPGYASIWIKYKSGPTGLVETMSCRL